MEWVVRSSEIPPGRVGVFRVYRTAEPPIDFWRRVAPCSGGAAPGPRTRTRSRPMPEPVGFVGLGNMGAPMAQNLARAGFPLVVRDIDPVKVEALRAQGAKVAGSPREVAAASRRVICMVETTAQAESVICGPGGIVESARHGDIVVCMSTIDPLVARRLHDELATKDVRMLDAPVSGGTVRAASGELSILVGGAPETFAACRDLFAAMGKNLFHVGPIGQGLALKLVNNMLV